MIWRAKVCVDTLTGTTYIPKFIETDCLLFPSDRWEMIQDGNKVLDRPHCIWVKVEYDDEEAR